MNTPDFNTLRSGKPDCPSDFALDRLAVGELAEVAASAVKAHLAACEVCAPRMAQRRFAGLPDANPGAMMLRIRQQLDESPSFATRAGNWIRGLVTSRAMPFALAMGAAAALLVVHPWSPSSHFGNAGNVDHVGNVDKDGDSDGLRIKGGPALHVFRLAGKSAEEVATGGRVTPGDSLRFVVDLPRAGHITIVGVEQSGTLYTAWPTLAHGTESLRPAGPAQTLPGAVALDDSLGRETLYLVHCPARDSTAATPHCSSRGKDARPACPDGCTLTPFMFEKTR